MPFDGRSYDDTILRVIDRVDRLICDEGHWFQGATGRSLPIRGGPISHCPILAIYEHGDSLEGEEEAEDYFWRAVRRLGDYPTIPDYNNADERTFPEIKALIAKARELRLADMMETV